jgi:UDP-GlcNAc:undecaprenyl-phosphate GlcNAc-1-phosphate transferase
MLVVTFTVPSIINISFKKRLFDSPSETRKIHKRIVPNFGGIAIFTSFLFTCALFIPSNLLPQANVLMAAGLILFMTGLQDDIVGLSPAVKFVAQSTSALIITTIANLRIENMHGIFNIYELSYFGSIALTMFFIVGIVNAFNLIDGIDGLAGSLGIILSLIYGMLFYKAGEIGWAYLSIALTGSLIGFLFYNVTPAKIFMGDSGSLLLGLVASVLSIKFMSTGVSTAILLGELHITSPVGLVFAILIIPIFDTLRVFTLRILKNTSPFTADSNHLHHRLLFLGLSHIQSSLILAVANIILIIMALALQNLSEIELISVLGFTILGVNGGFSLYLESYKRSLLSKTKFADVYQEGAIENKKMGVATKSFGEKVLENLNEN